MNRGKMKRFRVLLAALIAVTALVAVLLVLVKPFEPDLPPIKAIWITRFDYRTQDDVRRIILNVSRAGFTDVFFQVRGNGTSFYNSRMEPWAYELSGNDPGNLGIDPGWDPLQSAIDTAKGSATRIHAYMNVLPGWKGLVEPPVTAGQLWTEHPEWFMVDSLGVKMKPTSGWYAFVNPVIPEVRSHLRGIVKELCRYDVAGIHLDYIRYPHDYHLVAGQIYPDASEAELMRHSDFSYDDLSQAKLFDRYGWEVSKTEVTEFRCDSVTKVVRDISYVMQLEKPNGSLLSASVMGNPTEGKYYAFQDSGRWVRQGLIDWAVQMNYGTRSFNGYITAMKKACGRRKFAASVVIGLNCKNSTDVLQKQLQTALSSGSRGIALFSYRLLYDEDHRVNEKGLALLPLLRK
jgi:uncharacterized lipoprotein YddW (UPF0748 family)